MASGAPRVSARPLWTAICSAMFRNWLGIAARIDRAISFHLQEFAAIMPSVARRYRVEGDGRARDRMAAEEVFLRGEVVVVDADEPFDSVFPRPEVANIAAREGVVGQKSP